MTSGYSVVYESERVRKDAQAARDAAQPAEQRKLAEAFANLAANPFPSNSLIPAGTVRKLEGQANRWRYRVGNLRIVYSVDGRTVTVYRVADRKDVYRG